MGGMHRSSNRRGAVYGAWDLNRWAEPYLLMETWTIEESLESQEDDRAAAFDWTELGRLFVEYFKSGEIRKIGE